jgi:hypothetical protein
MPHNQYWICSSQVRLRCVHHCTSTTASTQASCSSEHRCGELCIRTLSKQAVKVVWYNCGATHRCNGCRVNRARAPPLAPGLCDALRRLKLPSPSHLPLASPTWQGGNRVRALQHGLHVHFEHGASTTGSGTDSSFSSSAPLHGPGGARDVCHQRHWLCSTATGGTRSRLECSGRRRLQWQR